MRLLSDMTKGTGLEEYLDRQISRVNDARGLKPGDPGFMKKSDFVEEVQEAEEREEYKSDLDIGNKLKAFSFLNNDDSLGEIDMENEPEEQKEGKKEPDKKNNIDNETEMLLI